MDEHHPAFPSYVDERDLLIALFGSVSFMSALFGIIFQTELLLELYARNRYLRRLKHSEKQDVRLYAIAKLMAWDQLRHPKVYPVVVEMFFTDRDPLIRQKIAEALGELGTPEAEATLRQALERETNFEVIRAIRTSLGKIASRKYRNKFPDIDGSSLSALWAIHPDWVVNPPSAAVLEGALEGMQWLPPVGGKIPLMVDENGVVRGFELLPPTLTAEEQAEEIIERRRSGELSGAYVHQVSVQGRLPDAVKFTAVALILNSPYPHDWDEPFFEAEWGEIAPLIHDGEGPLEFINQYWRSWGRTDFLMRISRVTERDPERFTVQAESLEEVMEQFIQRARSDRESLGPAMSETSERSRLRLELRAYQRLALTLHAAENTTPKELPEDLRLRLASRWSYFIGQLENLLSEYELDGVIRVKWFYGIDEFRGKFLFSSDSKERFLEELGDLFWRTVSESGPSVRWFLDPANEMPAGLQERFAKRLEEFWLRWQSRLGLAREEILSRALPRQFRRWGAVAFATKPTGRRFSES